MRILVLALALLPAAALAQDQTPVRPTAIGKPGCANSVPQYAKDRKPVKARKLGQEPVADQYLTVLRLDERGCDRPVKIRENIGDDAADQR
ncbi:hypothetical protein FHS95_003642 [Sphingomonas naasensis]|uniref:PepSY domain-containing protein n=1 Tax=Sphingomonas naasensis TaxID=1344951 RepID=A0A4S1WH72_9SPHN|nr:hypothetical protein [Sphingomonas naasensis]NIJ21931.1 hypothetical protein [Sphingomonas naasensis]TGX42379.1 hypothetical protein E5A74_11070 [Sphingomonas naasensis]